MNAQHTPGPWVYRDNAIYARDAQPEWAADDEDFADERICVVNLLGGMGGDDCMADTRLIAAAPELLTSCRAMVAAFGGDVPDWLQNEVAQMEAAIAKATVT